MLESLLLGDDGCRTDLDLAAPREIKPILDRDRGRALLPSAHRPVVKWVAEHYLAPPGMVVRQALPPGHFEQIELVAVPAAEPEPIAFGAPSRGGRGQSAEARCRGWTKRWFGAIETLPTACTRDDLAALPEQERDLDAPAAVPGGARGRSGSGGDSRRRGSGLELNG